MVQTKRIILAIGCALILLGLGLAVAQAQAPNLSLKITPASLKLAPGENRKALVTVTNTLTETMRDLNLTWFSDADVTVVATARPVSELVPNATAVWNLEITKTLQGVSSGGINFRLDYSTAVAKQTIPGVVLGSLDVQARALETMEKVATVRVQSSMQKVEENQAGILYLTVTNVTDVPITITKVILNRSDLVKVEEPPSAKQPRTILPNVSATYPYTVSVDVTLPGKRLFLFEVPVEWARADQKNTGTLSTPFEFSTDVFGSEILTLVGIPSLLLLPGILIFASALFVLTQSKVFSYTLDLKDIKFLAGAITVSLLVVVVYPLLGALTKFFGLSPNFLLGYSLRDLIGLWLGSILVGLFSGAIITLVMLGRHKVQMLMLARRTPSETDGALELLEKLARNKLGIAREQYQMTVDNRTQNVFALQTIYSSQTEFWVAPSIVVAWKPTVAGLAQEEYTRFKKQIAEATENYDDAKTLAGLLQKGKDKHWLGVNWDKNGNLRTPQKVRVDQVKRLKGLRRIVEEK